MKRTVSVYLGEFYKFFMQTEPAYCMFLNVKS